MYCSPLPDNTPVYMNAFCSVPFEFGPGACSGPDIPHALVARRSGSFGSCTPYAVGRTVGRASRPVYSLRFPRAGPRGEPPPGPPPAPRVAVRRGRGRNDTGSFSNVQYLTFTSIPCEKDQRTYDMLICHTYICHPSLRLILLMCRAVSLHARRTRLRL